MLKILISICARGGSKGVKNKNIRIMNNYPLIYYSILIAKKFSKNKDVIISLSTDSEQIKSIAKNYGIISDYKRPIKLSGDNSGKIETIYDLLTFEEKKKNQI